MGNRVLIPTPLRPYTDQKIPWTWTAPRSVSCWPR